MLRNELMVGSIVYFHPERKNEYNAFMFSEAFPEKPFKVIVTHVVGDGDFYVRSLRYGPETEQVVKAEQLSYAGGYTQDEHPDEHSDEIGINALIDRLEWLAVEQKVIDKETLLKIYGAIANGN